MTYGALAAAVYPV